MSEVEIASLAGLLFSQLPPNEDALAVLRIAEEMVRKYYLSAAGDTSNVIRLVPLEAH
jgi:hypothetical protein